LQITRLRLAGFKSFVEPTELRIEPGLTGVVGPNGCGKSNLVEALRWAMGESAARRMRASELDDVIFAGTAARPSRNFAEVALALDNQAGKAAPPYHDQPVVEVVRRLPRGGSSNYRINGRAARARDVQQMLADASTGARSTAIVAQGQIGEFVAAKPTDRRGLLEEAAGVAGLYSRRKEAETRLRAAETNLERLEDVLATLATQRQSLDKQARQARRYRKLQEQAKEVEAQLFAVRWQALATQKQQAKMAVREAEAAQEAAVRASAHAAKLQADAAAALPEKRKEEAAAAAAWQRLAVERDAKKSEAGRVAEEQKQVAARIASLESDIAREKTLAAEAAEAITALQAEAASLQEQEQQAGRTGEELAAALAVREQTLKNAEMAADQTARALATAQAERKAAERAKTDAETRLATLDRQLEKARQDLAEASSTLPSAESIEEAKQAATDTRRTRARQQDALTALREAEAAAETAAKTAEDKRREADRARLKLATEVETLRKLLASPGNEAPLLEHLSAEPGYEAALAAALGDDVAAGLDCTKPLHWRDGVPPAAADLPPDCEPLATHVQAPNALAARLAQVFVAPDEAAAEALAPSLKPGQRLVTREGGLWRWDGYTARAGAPTAGAQRLAQQNRVAALAQDLSEADKALAALAEESAQAAAAHSGAQQQRQQVRDALKDAESELVRAEQTLSRLSQTKALGESKLQAQRDTLERLQADKAAIEAQLTEAAQSLTQADRPDALEAAVIATRAAAADARVEWLAARDSHDQHVRAAEARASRLTVIARDTAGWERRASAEQRQSLEARLAEEHGRAAELAEKPAQLELALTSLHDALIDAEANRRVAADKLVEAETAQADRDRELRAAEAAAAEANATRIRAEATYEQARQASQNLTERLAERLSLAPAQLPEINDGAADDDLEQRLARLEREQMVLGDVNLRADTEIQELEERLSTLTAERDDLTAAIAKLRRGIGDLNKNARQKLLDAFETVNGHFERMFTRLFGGGEAQLRLVGDDDPLEAGLEVYACPPGKKPQALTALSGGERALTAVALLFAAFLTNPAPICVLDEVDAPLDDANVDRLCQLIEEIADEAGTRFLVITHHRLTMARMDRLYGVTMEERGVSHLVSVDLRQADLFRKTNPALRAAE
jgi:chromosome segregation protein